MAKLKTRTNQPVVDGEGLFEHLAQDGNVTQVGGDLEVDGGINAQPQNASILGSLTVGQWVVSPYNREQIIDIIKKNRVNGFTYSNDTLIGQVTLLNENAIEGDEVVFTIEGKTNYNWSYEEFVGETFRGWVIVGRMLYNQTGVSLMVRTYQMPF